MSSGQDYSGGYYDGDSRYLQQEDYQHQWPPPQQQGYPHGGQWNGEQYSYPHDGQRQGERYGDPQYQQQPQYGWRDEEYYGHHGYGPRQYEAYAPQVYQARPVGARGAKERRRKRNPFLAALITLLLLTGAGFGGYYTLGEFGFFGPDDYTGSGNGQDAIIEVRQGDSGGEIAKTLTAAGVVKSEVAFLAASARNPDSKTIQAGWYKLQKEMSADAAVLALLDLKNRYVKTVVVTEGMSTFDIYKKLATKLGRPIQDFQDAAKDPVALGVDETWFTRKDGRAITFRSAEGFLFPATYEFDPDTTPEQALKAMVAKFNQVTAEIRFTESVASKSAYSPYEALIAASIAQKEVHSAEDFPKLTQVLYFRAYSRRFSCNCLKADSTLNYFFKLNGAPAKPSKDITQAELEDESNPYNTYAHSKMPPTPIGNPGKTALNAAVNPADTSYRYWIVIDASGTAAFTSSQSTHCSNTKKAIQAGLPARPC